MNRKIALTFFVVAVAAIGIGQAGMQVKAKQLPRVIKAGSFSMPKNMRNTTAFTPSKSQALQLAGLATGQKLEDLPLGLTLTPSHPMTSQATAIATNAFLVVPGDQGNWVFAHEKGVLLCGATVPAGSKYALVTVAGSSDVHAESVSLSSGPNTSTHQFSADKGSDFNYSTTFDVSGANSVGFSVAVDTGNDGTVWVSNVSVQFLK